MSTVLHHWLANLRIAYHRQRAVESLSRLSDAQLLDIGLERGTIEDHVREGLRWQAFEPAAKPALRPSIQGCG